MVVAPAAAAGGSTRASSSSAWSKTVAKANQEGAVTLYTVATQTMYAALQAAFEKAYPQITMSVFRGNTGQVIAKMEAGGDDVAQINQDQQVSTLDMFGKEGKLVTPLGPNFKNPK